MNLLKATGTIGGLTLVSRIAGFAREMLMSRVMGASWQADAFFVAFRLPNTFRRLFGEGAFSAGFVPLYSQRLHGPRDEEGARHFSEEVLAVFLPTLVLFTLVFEIIMPRVRRGDLGLHRREARAGDVPDPITFPYLVLISLVSLFSGILNSLARFTAAAFAPALAQPRDAVRADLRPRRRGDHRHRAGDRGDDRRGPADRLAVVALPSAPGSSLKLRRPRMTPGVRQFVRVVIPATLGAGVYQISAFIDTFFLDPDRHRRDELFQLCRPPQPAAARRDRRRARHRDPAAGQPPRRRRRAEQAAAVQGQAAELAMLLCLPAALALCGRRRAR